MDSPFLLALITTIDILTGPLLALYAIGERTTRRARRHFYIALAVFGLAADISFILLADAFVSPFLFKLYFIKGLPICLLIALATLKRPVLEQIFVYSMVGLIELILHMTAIFLYDLETVLQIVVDQPLTVCMLLHALHYLVLFLLSLPLLLRLLRHIMPNELIFHYRHLGLYITLLPAFVTIALSQQFYDNILFHSLADRLPRIIAPLLILIIYRLIIVSGSELSDVVHRESHVRSLQLQIDSLKACTEQQAKHQRAMSVLRHDLRHYDATLAQLLRGGHTDEALELIAGHGVALTATRDEVYCKQPIVNAAITSCFARLREAGIPFTHKLNLPADCPRQLDSDLALLLSNLIENACHASLKQPPDRRRIMVHLESDGTSHVLCVANQYDGPAFLGPDGLPATTRPGHGLGTESLRQFAMRYAARIHYGQTDGMVRCYVYWTS